MIGRVSLIDQEKNGNSTKFVQFLAKAKSIHLGGKVYGADDKMWQSFFFEEA